jgi:hypothetical protein
MNVQRSVMAPVLDEDAEMLEWQPVTYLLASRGTPPRGPGQP